LSSWPTGAVVDELEIFWVGYIAVDRPKGQTEADVLAAVYRNRRQDLSMELEGQYALAIVDRERHSLLLSHDEFGLAPLYYARDGSDIVVASHLEDLVREIGVGELDENYLADFLFEQNHYGSRTPYRRIRRLQFAESVTFDASGCRAKRVWTIDRVAPLRASDPSTYEDGLRGEVSRAVAQARSPADLTWCELSGGLDSSTVFAVAMADDPAGLEAFSLLYPGTRHADERRYIDCMLRRYPAPWHSLDATNEKPFSRLPQRFCPLPRIGLVTEGWAVGYDALLAQAGVDVVLTGQGGDAVFVGDSPEPYLLGDLARTGSLRALWAQLHAYSAGSRQKRSPYWFFQRYALRSTRRAWRGRSLTYEAQWPSWLSPAFARRADVRERAERAYVPAMPSVADRAFFELVLRCANVSSTHESERDDGAQFRHPLLSPRLVRYIASTPWSEKAHPTIDRLLQRRAYADVLPRDIALRKSKARPDELFFAGLAASRETYELLSHRPQIVERGYVDRDGWSRALSLARVGQVDGIRWLLSAAALEIWLTRLEAFEPKGGPRLSPRPVA
jgi:asparagine synthase (glutamine-hydrolysing)